MTGYFAITGELHPLPPSYKYRSRLCHEGKSFTYREVMVKVENFKCRTNAGIVIDGDSIFDIQVINVFPHETLIAAD